MIASSPDFAVPTHAQDWLHRSGLRPLRLGGRTLLPIVQGGMGIGVSGNRLAGSVAALGGVGTLSAVDLRRHHPDLMERTRDLPCGCDGESRHQPGQPGSHRARDCGCPCAQPRQGPAGHQRDARHQRLRPSITRRWSAVSTPWWWAQACRWTCRTWRASTRRRCSSILSDARGVQLLVKKWERKKRLPDAIVIEHPRLAGGHLGAARIADLTDPRFEFANALPQVQTFLERAGLARAIPLVAAGGIGSFEDIARLQSLGAAAVQLGTAFAVTQR